MRYEVMRFPIQSYLRALLSPLLFKQSSDCAPIQSYNGVSFLGVIGAIGVIGVIGCAESLLANG